MPVLAPDATGQRLTAPSGEAAPGFLIGVQMKRSSEQRLSFGSIGPRETRPRHASSRTTYAITTRRAMAWPIADWLDHVQLVLDDGHRT